MKATTHQALALCGLLLMERHPPQDLEGLLIQFCAVTMGAMLPDLDSPYSAFGKRCRPVSRILFKCFGHRAITHSALAVAMIYLLLAITPFYEYSFLVCFGYALHLIGDMLFIGKSGGVMLFWPYKRKIAFGALSVGGWVESVTFISLMCGFAWLLYQRYSLLIFSPLFQL